jgi:hypothetical protein
MAMFLRVSVGVQRRCPGVLARRAEGETPSGQPARLVLSEAEGCRRYLLAGNTLLQVQRSLRNVLWFAQIAPIVLVGTEGEDFLSLGGEA